MMPLKGQRLCQLLIPSCLLLGCCLHKPYVDILKLAVLSLCKGCSMSETHIQRLANLSLYKQCLYNLTLFSYPSIPFLCTYPSTCTCSMLLSKNFSSVLFSANLVIALARLSFLSIYQILVISLCLYDCQSAMISIMRRFSFVVPSFTKHLYNEYKSVQRTIRV